jgi:hypothetical protein
MPWSAGRTQTVNLVLQKDASTTEKFVTDPTGDMKTDEFVGLQEISKDFKG